MLLISRQKVADSGARAAFFLRSKVDMEGDSSPLILKEGYGWLASLRHCISSHWPIFCDIFCVWNSNGAAVMDARTDRRSDIIKSAQQIPTLLLQISSRTFQTFGWRDKRRCNARTGEYAYARRPLSISRFRPITFRGKHDPIARETCPLLERAVRSTLSLLCLKSRSGVIVRNDEFALLQFHELVNLKFDEPEVEVEERRRKFVRGKLS